MAIESAVTLMILVVGFAGLMEIVQAFYTDDRMSRAARAAARVLALNPSADACATIRLELSLPEDFDCSTTWTLTVDRGVGPGTLPAMLEDSVASGTGDMVLVRIGWKREPFSFSEPEDEETGIQTVSETALGLARCEIELCGQAAS